MKNKAIVISILVLVMSLFVGVIAAQEDDTTANRPGRGRNLLHDIVEIVTEATGLTQQEIMEQLQDGATLAEVVENAGGDVDAVIADVETLMSEQIEELFNTEFDFEGRDGNGFGIRDRVRNGVLGEVATAISAETGLETTEILQQVRDGEILADIITNNGGDVDTVVAAVVEAVTTNVNERVESEQITQEQADTILENLEETVTDLINGELELPLRDRGGRGGRGNN